MTDSPDALRKCPDCGGILEPVRPEYVLRLDAEGALHGAHGTSSEWRCFLCGYHERRAERDLIAEV